MIPSVPLYWTLIYNFLLLWVWDTVSKDSHHQFFPSSTPPPRVYLPFPSPEIWVWPCDLRGKLLERQVASIASLWEASCYVRSKDHHTVRKPKQPRGEERCPTSPQLSHHPSPVTRCGREEAFRWCQSLLTSDCNFTRHLKWELPSEPTEQNCFKPLSSGLFVTQQQITETREQAWLAGPHTQPIPSLVLRFLGSVEHPWSPSGA